MNISLSLLCAFIFEWSTSIASEKGEPNVIPTGYYFDDTSNKIYITTMKGSKKVSNLK
jgi:nitroimidazol reductase NimA-like FMN-containing flavoprotein (pyridoxamine 5'-phosphate oxidase superfamily)